MLNKSIFIEKLKKVPEEIWGKVLKKAYVKCLFFPEPVGIDTFLRGEGSEIHFIQALNEFDSSFSQNPDKNKYSGAPDGMFLLEFLMLFFDMKIKIGGMQPGVRKRYGIIPKFIKKMWDFKKTQSGSNEFKTDNDFYILVDPVNVRIAVCEATVLFSKKYPKNGSRICFGIAPEDVTIIFDGYGKYDFTHIKADPLIDQVLKFVDDQAEKVISDHL